MGIPARPSVARMAVGALFVACNGNSSGASGNDDHGPAGAAGSSGTAGQPSASGSSCAGMNGTECQNGDCCASPLVMGGTFEQGDPDAFSATVSSFLLDRYEVTVGRFRNFVAAYDAWRAAGNPAADSGANAGVPGSGWSASWNGFLAASSAVLTSDSGGVDCDPNYATWSDSGNDTLPMNCVDWYTSFAFCIWDGKRMPTESEWEYAAAGGADNTVYVWGNTPIPDNTLNTANLAVYDCLGDGTTVCEFTDILPVGSRPAGNGRYGQSDLAGSMWEWNLDWFAIYPTSAQTNYANIALGSSRVIRGGDWGSPASTLPAAARYSYGFPTARFMNVGFRCAGNL
jgi:formylglycine-generating enzyme